MGPQNLNTKQNHPETIDWEGKKAKREQVIRNGNFRWFVLGMFGTLVLLILGIIVWVSALNIPNTQEATTGTINVSSVLSVQLTQATSGTEYICPCYYFVTPNALTLTPTLWKCDICSTAVH